VEKILVVGFEVFTAVVLKSIFFWEEDTLQNLGCSQDGISNVPL
jgi:hypothetical protein